MASLRARMAAHGFESNDDYDYRVRRLLDYPTRGLRSLSVEGDSTRRKTAFANALARALEWPQLLYHDFTAAQGPAGRVEVPDLEDAEGTAPVPLTAFDRTVSEACAFSEAESTILILDQLQAADFAEHLRLYRFVTSTEWHYPLATLRANARRFLLILISEEPLFHSLQKECFRIWTEPERLRVDYAPADFGLDADAAPVLDALAAVFRQLGTAPPPSGYAQVVRDIAGHARTVEHFRQSIYAWTEGLPWEALADEALAAPLAALEESLQGYLGLQTIEIGGAGSP